MGYSTLRVGSDHFLKYLTRIEVSDSDNSDGFLRQDVKITGVRVLVNVPRVLEKVD